MAAVAWQQVKPLTQGGLLKFTHGGEFHAYNPDVVTLLQKAVQSGKKADYQVFADRVNQRAPAALRDLLALDTSDRPPINLDRVEPAEAIFPRFDSAGMSIGALSPEAHEALAVAMNRLGGSSNSGEGGEDPARFGTERNSASSRWPRRVSVSPPTTWSMPTSCRSRSPRAPSRARAGSCRDTR